MISLTPSGKGIDDFASINDIDAYAKKKQR
jgi:hypothetical protein